MALERKRIGAGHEARPCERKLPLVAVGGLHLDRAPAVRSDHRDRFAAQRVDRQRHAYQTTTPAPGGFFHPYGDYSWMTTDGTTTWVIWGEGTSYIGPGTVYAAPF